jgi:hypothetical protein
MLFTRIREKALILLKIRTLCSLPLRERSKPNPAFGAEKEKKKVSFTFFKEYFSVRRVDRPFSGFEANK